MVFRKHFICVTLCSESFPCIVLVLMTVLEEDLLTVPSLQMRKLKYKSVKSVASGLRQ